MAATLPPCTTPQPASQRAADLILLDLRLPTRSGAQLLEALKADPRLGRIPVVVLTGPAAAPDLCHAHQHHANAFVTKPVGLQPSSTSDAHHDRRP
jgi:CheY-like chemotaxis protein